MDFIDVHCHLHDSRLVTYLDFMLERAKNEGITYMVSCATKESNFQRTLDLAQLYPSIIPCIGIHPWFLETLSFGWEKILGETIQNSSCGVGETGLDFMDKNFDTEKQIKVFSYHLNLANDLKRPVQIHIIKAWDVLIKILKKNGPLKVPGILHSYSGSADLVRELLQYNLYFSFSGFVTRKNVKKAIKSIAAVPKDRILVETDSPDMIPEFKNPIFNGFFHDTSLLNEPYYLPTIVRAVAHYSQMSYEDFGNLVYANSLSVLAPILKGS